MGKRYYLLFLVSATGLSILCYNYWSFSCGRCDAESLLTVSLPAKILIGINLLAVLILTYLTNRSPRLDHSKCPCGARLHPGWYFCPECGQARPVSR
ncbi:hypothetical protein [Geopsychrobacter electrodiphilus]|uniref:hypothetical protein n=1 Tax=Geopsychrobacter electrodiphilus TaxID=225196 RepID=UPI0003604C75|nr:hypothetical protein [Geopsychrobacter electrodiphilus]